MNIEKGFSLVELIIVCVIIGVLMSIAMPTFFATREKALDNEAKASLRLIQSAQKAYRMENGGYIACTTTGGVNTSLRLYLPTGASRSWNYKVDGVDATSFVAKAQRTSDSRVWCMNQGADTATSCTW